jgi:hypothetical protein
MKKKGSNICDPNSEVECRVGRYIDQSKVDHHSLASLWAQYYHAWTDGWIHGANYMSIYISILVTLYRNCIGTALQKVQVREKGTHKFSAATSLRLLFHYRKCTLSTILFTIYHYRSIYIHRPRRVS